MKNSAQHRREVQQIAVKIKDYSKSFKSKKIRFYHGGTNSTRTQDNKEFFFIDISHLNDVVEVNTQENYVLAEANVPMDKLIKITQQYGLLPAVVMEFPGITCGGAVNGASLESSSYKYGQLSDICEEYEIVTGNGTVMTASHANHADLFYGISGAYGSLGLVTLVKIRLVSSSAYVKTTFHPVRSYDGMLTTIKNAIQSQENDYVDGVMFDHRRGVVITGKKTDSGVSKIQTYTRARDPWFYETCQTAAREYRAREELIPITDYLFRYNRGAFWMAEHGFTLLHMPNNKITRFLLNPFLNTRKLYDAFHALNISQKYFIQDIYFPYDEARVCFQYNEKHLGIFPLWLCPIKPTASLQKLSPHYINSDMLLDIGIWGQSEQYLTDPIEVNRKFEAFVHKHNGRKMLYAHAYYTEDEFWNIYDKKWYDSLRKKYAADEVLPDVWQKVHVSDKYVTHKWKGALKLIVDTIKGKHINTQDFLASEMYRIMISF